MMTAAELAMMKAEKRLFPCAGEIRSPRAVKGSKKYGKEGMMRKEMFKGLELPKEVEKALAEVGNHGLAKSTWSNYRTAERMLLHCQRDTSRSMELPLVQEQILIFVDWLIRKRGVKHGTVSNYLAGIRQLHVMKGIAVPEIRSKLVNLIITGKKNMDRMEQWRQVDKSRLPVTLSVMSLLKATLREADMMNQEKLLTWAVCCLAFNGAFRIHELLSKEEGRFDPIFTLLDEDLKIIEESSGSVIQVRVKWPKEEKQGREFTVEVFETKGVNCPVKALKKWWSTGPPREKGAPAFRKPDGAAFTGRNLNETMGKLLTVQLGPGGKRLRTHSFRAAVPTMLGAAGFSDEEIMAVGRWSSRAFECYVKLARTKRRAMARTIAGLD